MTTTPDRAALTEALEVCDLATILPALAAATGDLSLLDPTLRPSDAMFAETEAGLSLDQAQQVRALAERGLNQLLDHGPVDALPREDLVTIMHWLLPDRDVVEQYFDLFVHELGLADLRTPTWSVPAVAPGRTLSAIVIGAGMSGIVTAHRLLQAGLTVTVIEKDAEIGGTWFENTYPGCRVDVANHLYSYSFGTRENWTNYHSPQCDLLAYFRRVANDCGVTPHVRLATTVTGCTWDEAAQQWQVQLESDRGHEIAVVDVVVSCVGQLNHPRIPDLPGIEAFGGPQFHTARWNHEVDLSGARVGIVGTGSSALQVIPELAGTVAHLTVFERSPSWLAPALTYRQSVPEGLRLLFDTIPNAMGWLRLWLVWKNCEGLLALARVDDTFDGGGTSVSLMNEGFREILTAVLEAYLPGRPDLLQAMTPDYPPLARRIVPDDGFIPAALLRDDVDLIHHGVTAVTPSGVVTDDGAHHDVDVIIWATGFHAQDFLLPMPVVGRGGLTLDAAWDGEPAAHLGICVPGFPNLFFTYGPNTNIVINGSIIYFTELEVDWITKALHHLVATNASSLEARPEALERWVNYVDATNAKMAWGASSVMSWYKSASGRVTQNWGESLLAYYDITKTFDPSDYVVTPRRPA